MIKLIWSKSLFSSPQQKAQVSYSNRVSSVFRRKRSHFRFLWRNRWAEFNETWQEARFQRPLPSLSFSWPIGKTSWPPGLWLAETFSTYPKPPNGIQWNLRGSKISTSPSKFVFFGQLWKKKMAIRPLICCDILTSPQKFAWNSTKLWDLALSSKISMPFTKFVFLGRSENQDGRHGLWLAETFLTSPLKLLNGIQGNLTGIKISTSSTKFVSRRSEKQDGCPGLWLAETF